MTFNAGRPRRQPFVKEIQTQSITETRTGFPCIRISSALPRQGIPEQFSSGVPLNENGRG